MEFQWILLHKPIIIVETSINQRFLNVGHAAYRNLDSYPEIQHDYLREHMMKQYVLLYLDEGKYDVFGEGFADMDPQEAAEKVIQKIENVFYLSLKS